MILDIKISTAITPPLVIELLNEDFKTKHHDEAASDDHEDHVEEEVSVVVMTNTVVEPGTVVVHLENTGLTHTDNTLVITKREQTMRLFYLQ